MNGVRRTTKRKDGKVLTIPDDLTDEDIEDASVKLSPRRQRPCEARLAARHK
jgi:hypothetical protein